MIDPTRPIPVEDLLSHADWVRSLAFKLVEDESAAEDLIQETWLAALRNPPKREENLRGWFRRVMFNLLHRRHRDETRRSGHEEAASRPEWSGSEEDVVERAELQQRLVRLVLELPEPFRTAVLLRHFEELQPRQIAARLEVPLDTISSRLKRGHAMLRERLEAEDGPQWPKSLMPLLLWPPQSGPATPPAPNPASMRPGVLVAAGVVALVLVGLWTWSAIGPSATRPDAPSGERATARAPVHPAAGPRVRGPGLGERAGLPGEEPAPAGETALEPQTAAAGRVLPLEVRLDTGADPDPRAIVLLVAPFVTTQNSVKGAAHEVAAAKGLARVDLAVRDEQGHRVAEWEIRVDHRDFLPAAVRVRMPTPVEATSVLAPLTIRLRRASIVTGSVAFDGARPDDVADVGTISLGDGAASIFDRVTVSAAAPRFRVRAVPGAAMLLAAAAADRIPVAQPIQLGPGAETDVGVVTLEPGVRISGRVSSPRIPLSPKGYVMITTSTAPATYFTLGAHFISYDHGRAARWRADAPVDAEGRFSAGGFFAGSFRVQCLVTGQLAAEIAKGLTRVVDAPAEHVDFGIDGGLVTVRVRGGDGPVKDATISATPPASCRTDADGVATFLGVPGTTYALRAKAAGHVNAEAQAVAPVAGAEAPPVEIALTAASAPAASAVWLVTLKPPLGEPPTIAGFGFYQAVNGPAGSFTQFTKDVTATNGVFRVEGIQPGRWRVEIRPGCEWIEPTGFLLAEPVERVFAAGPETADTIAVSPAGRLVVTAREADGSVAQNCRCSVRDAAGRELPLAFCVRRDAGVSLATAGLSPYGATDAYPALPPGRYTVECILTKLIRKSVTVDVVAGRVAEAVVVFDPR